MGIPTPPPETLDDAALHRILWQWIRALAGMKVFLVHTDHLSDRELYCRLRNDWLFRSGPGHGSFTTYFDPVGSFSEEDVVLLYRYYSDRERLTHWQELFPGRGAPKQEKPPYHRDAYLPTESRPRNHPSAEPETGSPQTKNQTG